MQIENEFNFLQQKAISTDPSRIFHDWPTHVDMEIVDLEKCFYGPTLPVVENARRGNDSVKCLNVQQMGRKHSKTYRYENFY